MSCSRLQALIREGQLKINQLVIRKPKTRLKIGDSIEVFCRNRFQHAPKGMQ
ncbi:RNA-binding S4 domain-containing protein [Bartonella apis]|uniref:RNA-binding S4 domain-containing protein n=1 Tax=Bartonella apis TaxID=1686310 RepID=UPI001178A56D